MSLIPEDELERIKRETDLAAVVRSRGVALAQQGGDLVGLCPFHDDTSPSLHVTPAKRLWRCVSCHATGNVIQFIQRFDGISFRHAFELLRSGSAFAKAPTCQPVKLSTVRKLPSPLAADADDQAALRQVVDYYHERLKQTPSALEYLRKRGLSPAAIDAFRVGFVDRTLGLRLPDKRRKEGAAIRARLEALGVMRSTGHEHLRGRVVFPVVSESGAITQLYGRAIDDGGKHERHCFLPGPLSSLFNPAALRSAEVILCEGIIDALTFWCAGFKHVTTSYSAKALPEEMLEALVAAKVRRVLIAFDRDEAGDRGADEVAAQLMARGIDCRRVLFPHGQDANSYALAVSPPEKSLGILLNAAQWLGGKGSAQTKGSALQPGRGAAPAPVADALTLRASASASSSLAAKAASSSEVAAGEKVVSPASTPTLEQRGEHHFLTLGEREYRLGGLEKLTGAESLKLTLRLKVGERFHLDALDLARDGERRRFIERAAEETGLHADLLKRDMGRLLLAVETHQVAVAAKAANATKAGSGAEAPALSAQDRSEALAWAQAPDLVGRLRAALARVLVGEDRNALVLYLVGTSRLLDRPLAGIVQSPSAAGKTTLMDAALSFFPEEDRVKYSAMTGQSLFYMGDADLKHKILAIVEEAGAEKASYALKLLQSEGELTIASTGKNPATGRMETQEYHVEGPVAILLTTTSADLDEELQNRCLTLAVDDSPEQTARIHALQRERRTLAGLVAKAERATVLGLLRNVQRLLQPLDVLNPFAPALTFTNGRARNRRDHEKYLTLIDSIALLHQHQRPRGRHEAAGGRVVEYVSVTLEDIALANELAPEVLGRSLDELPPQTRRLLDHIRALVRSRRAQNEGAALVAPGRDAVPAPAHGERPASARHAAVFSRRELREACGWSLTQVRTHLERLVELEYLEIRHNRPGSSFVYELMIDADAPQHIAHIGLIDVEELRRRVGNAHAQRDAQASPGAGASPCSYGAKVAGFKPGVAEEKGEVAAGGETPPPPQKPESSEGETAA